MSKYTGLKKGASELCFSEGQVKGGDYYFTSLEK